MKTKFLIILSVSFLLIFQSCSTNQHVVSNGIFQKRKYTKGWHYNGIKKSEKRKSIHTKENQVNSDIVKQNIANIDLCKTTKLDSITNKSVKEKINETKHIVITKTIQAKELISQETVQLGNKIKTIVKVLTPAKKSEYYIPKKSIEGWSLASFIMIIIFIVLLILSITVFYDAFGAFLLSILGMFVSLILSFVFALVGIVRYNNQEFYSISLFFSIFSITITLIVCLILILSVI